MTMNKFEYQQLLYLSLFLGWQRYYIVFY